MNPTLFELVNKVADETTFLNFLDALRKDKLANEEWANETIELFLDAAVEWGTASTNGLPYYEKPDNPWRRCAQILYMGKVYE
ncbi:hypothetical protein PA598K_03943 [Paenibacillus sp. 598K]|uniref:DUF7660 family protein n=1 Tax=Paenibacillus sp. 598K TaxID=1117987 RepID=UPI000FF92915|nr:hypothetical protein [Paenibacillus sp. 598K]GBF75526.1 hypothetical protein PA598K_03943 [Paenibacillus sp. 598K]